MEEVDLIEPYPSKSMDPSTSKVCQPLNHYYLMNNGYCTDHADSCSPPQISREQCTLVGAFITEEYGLLRKVMSFLPLIHLNSAALVCRKWAEAARLEKQSRSSPYWYVFQRLSSAMSWNNFVNGIYCPPSVCLWFSYQDIEQYEVLSSDGQVHTSLIESMEKLVKGIKCPLIAVSSCGIVGTTTDLEITREGPSYRGRTWGAVGILLLPICPGVEVNQFKLSRRDCRRIRQGCTTADWLRNLVGGPDKPIRCLLLFCSRNSLATSQLARQLQDRQEVEIAIGGATIEAVEVNETDEPVVGIAFYGDNMSASSIVIGEKVKSEKDIETKIKQFREGTIDGEHNIGLMFSCIGRSLKKRSSVERDNVESKLFRRHFKSRPLHGVIGNGEIGIDCLPGKSVENRAKKAKSDPEFVNMLHSYSTVFVHLALNTMKGTKHERSV